MSVFCSYTISDNEELKGRAGYRSFVRGFWRARTGDGTQGLRRTEWTCTFHELKPHPFWFYCLYIVLLLRAGSPVFKADAEHTISVEMTLNLWNSGILDISYHVWFYIVLDLKPQDLCILVSQTLSQPSCVHHICFPIFLCFYLLSWDRVSPGCPWMLWTRGLYVLGWPSKL